MGLGPSVQVGIKLDQQVRAGGGEDGSQPLAPLLPREASCCGSWSQKPGRFYAQGKLLSGKSGRLARLRASATPHPVFAAGKSFPFTLSRRGVHTHGSLAVWVFTVQCLQLEPGRSCPRCTEDKVLSPPALLFRNSAPCRRKRELGSNLGLGTCSQ